MIIPSPWIHEVEDNFYIVRTDAESVWYKGRDFYGAVHMCNLIKRFQLAIQNAHETIMRMEEDLAGDVILLTEEV